PRGRLYGGVDRVLAARARLFGAHARGQQRVCAARRRDRACPRTRGRPPRPWRLGCSASGRRRSRLRGGAAPGRGRRRERRRPLSAGPGRLAGAHAARSRQPAALRPDYHRGSRAPAPEPARVKEMTMLQNSPMYAYLPAKDISRARKFYEEKLGFKPRREVADGVAYEFAKGTGCFLYPT